jgi:hypothetical protein
MNLALFPHDILYYIFTFDTRFVLQNNKWVFIDKISKDDDRYSLLQNRMIIIKSVINLSNNIVKKHKNVITIYNNKLFLSDIEFSHYLYKTIRYYL